MLGLEKLVVRAEDREEDTIVQMFKPAYDRVGEAVHSCTHQHDTTERAKKEEEQQDQRKK